MKYVMVFFFLVLSILSCRKNKKDLINNKIIYNELIREAKQFYRLNDYSKAADKYEKAFKLIGGINNTKDGYNAARSFVLAGDNEKSFNCLFELTKSELNYDSYDYIISDTIFKPLHRSTLWNNLISKIKDNKEKNEKNYDKLLVALLDTIFNEDQKYRKSIDSIKNKFGMYSPRLKKHWETIHRRDSINWKKVKMILDEYGWLGKDKIGKQGNNTLFLVLQHADIDSQIKYLPMMKNAVRKGNAKPTHLALLEDRVSIKLKNKQIYGSQLMSKPDGSYYVLPIINPENVDRRRAEIGLNNMADYLSNWNMTWNVSQHLKMIDSIERKKNDIDFK